MAEHYGLRQEAREMLARAKIPCSEAVAREKRDRAREVGDDEAAVLWSRVLWRWFLRAPQPRRSIVLVSGG